MNIFKAGSDLNLSIHNAGSIARTGAYFGQGTIPILLDDVGCHGTESRLTSCTYSSHTLDCSHRDDAGVTCSSAISGGECSTIYDVMA